MSNLDPRFWLFCLALLLVSACGDAAGDGPNTALDVVRFQDGDTTVVRTVSGSTWGAEADLVPEVEIGVLDGDPAYMLGRIVALAVDSGGRIFALDGQALTVRVYGPDGVHIGDWGRDGNGPGELAGPDGGLAVLSDGRVVARDPGNARLQVFTAGGERAAEWPVVPSGFSTSNAMKVNVGDTLYTYAIMNMGAASPESWIRGMVGVYEGEIVDSVPSPDVGYEGAMLRAESEGSVSIRNVPFTPREHAEWHPEGFYLHGISDRYAFSLLSPDGPLRIEREAPPVSVASGERRWHRAQVTTNLRRTEPNWQWDAADIPATKASYLSLTAARDGRIWVQRPTLSTRERNPDHDPSDPLDDAPEFTWTEPLAFDVFERDGTFLGTVQAPPDLVRYPRPLFMGDHVWGIVEDDFGVQRIVRYRIQIRDSVTE